ncbi:hypothetical protein ACFFX0_05170 [Citricoccus parietis]|uniref:Uncharacterized protein n=1 Tax=Citricoccus parietis TaxID=592307 RepID=A0ABV5FV96_9MICC
MANPRRPFGGAAPGRCRGNVVGGRLADITGRSGWSGCSRGRLRGGRPARLG